MIATKILATIFSVVVLLKIIMFLCAGKKFYSKLEGYWNIKGLAPMVFAGSAVVFYFLIEDGQSPITISAVFLGVAGFYGSILLLYPPVVKRMYNEIIGDMKKLWLQWVFIALLAVWTLKELVL